MDALLAVGVYIMILMGLLYARKRAEKSIMQKVYNIWCHRCLKVTKHTKDGECTGCQI